MRMGEKIRASAKAGPGVHLDGELSGHKNPQGNKQPLVLPLMPHPDSNVVVETGKGWKHQTNRQWADELVPTYCKRVKIFDIEDAHLIRSRDNTSHSPLPFVLFGGNWTIATICRARLPWAWGDPFAFFFHRNHEAAALAHAERLAAKVRRVATAERRRLDAAVEAVRRARELGEDPFPTTKHDAWLASFHSGQLARANNGWGSE